MKRYSIVAAFCIFSVCIFANENPVTPAGAFRFSEGLATVVVDGKWGYINTSGELAIAAVYQFGTGFRSGVALVNDGSENFYIDVTGVRVASPEGAFYSNDESSPLVNFMEPDGKGGAKWGFKNQQGQVVIAPIYASTYRFREGLGAFAVADETVPDSRMRYGFLDLQGNEVIPPIYQVAIEFNEGLAKVIQNYRHFFINKTGERAFPKDFDFAFDFSEGLAAVNIEDIIDVPALNSVIPGKWGYIDKRGEMVIPAVYQQAYSFEDGLAKVQQNLKWGLIDKNGEFVVEPVYMDIAWHQGDAAVIVAVENQLEYRAAFGLVDLQGNVIVEPQYLHMKDISEGLVSVATGDWQNIKWGHINLAGDVVIQPVYDQVYPFSEGFAAVWIGDKQGYIDRSGRVLWNPSK